MAVAQAAPVVVAAAAYTVYLPAACRGISPRAANGTTGVFRWRPRRRALARARPAPSGGRVTGRGRGLGVVAEFGGTYEDGFEDVHKSRWQRVGTRWILATRTRTRQIKILPVGLPVPAGG